MTCLALTGRRKSRERPIVAGPMDLTAGVIMVRCVRPAALAAIR
jgi:hypothetical protein